MFCLKQKPRTVYVTPLMTPRLLGYLAVYDTSAGFWGSLSWSRIYEMVSEFGENDGDDGFLR